MIMPFNTAIRVSPAKFSPIAIRKKIPSQSRHHPRSPLRGDPESVASWSHSDVENSPRKSGHETKEGGTNQNSPVNSLD